MRSSRPTLRRVALVVLVVLSPLALDGCLSIGVTRRAAETPGTNGALEVRIFEKSGDRDRSAAAATPVFSELVRLDQGARTPVGRSMATNWSVPDLAPGRYALRVSTRLDDRGDVVPVPHPGEKTFEESAGQTTSVDVVLSKVPVLWIVLAAITVIVLVILSIDWARHGKIPLPPHPPLPVFVAVDVPLGARAHRPEPGVADVFPARGSVVAARRVSVAFFLTQPLADDGLGEDAVLALGSKSGAIEGRTSYRPEEQIARFTPSRDFTPGETVTVTLDLSRLKSRGGRAGEGKFTTSFLVPTAR